MRVNEREANAHRESHECTGNFFFAQGREEEMIDVPATPPCVNKIEGGGTGRGGKGADTQMLSFVKKKPVHSSSSSTYELPTSPHERAPSHMR